MLVWEDVKGSPGLLNESVREGFWIGKVDPSSSFLKKPPVFLYTKIHNWKCLIFLDFFQNYSCPTNE